jgi:hypothetical protein
MLESLVRQPTGCFILLQTDRGETLLHAHPILVWGLLALGWAWIIWAWRKPREIAEDPKAKRDSSTQLGEQRMDNEWRRVWAQLTNEELEDRLFTYFWLAMRTPNPRSNRLRELVDEAERRGQAAMVERAKLRAADIPAGITCSDDENESAG